MAMNPVFASTFTLLSVSLISACGNVVDTPASAPQKTVAYFEQHNDERQATLTSCQALESRIANLEAMKKYLASADAKTCAAAQQAQKNVAQATPPAEPIIDRNRPRSNKTFNDFMIDEEYLKRRHSGDKPPE
jgi:hypothetical protein